MLDPRQRRSGSRMRISEHNRRTSRTSKRRIAWCQRNKVDESSRKRSIRSGRERLVTIVEGRLTDRRGVYLERDEEDITKLKCQEVGIESCRFYRVEEEDQNRDGETQKVGVTTSAAVQMLINCNGQNVKKVSNATGRWPRRVGEVKSEEQREGVRFGEESYSRKKSQQHRQRERKTE